MERLIKDYDIKFVGLKLGTHQFDYELDNEFFKLFEYSDFESSELKIQAALEKKNTLMELNLKLNGQVKVPCDLTNELFWMDISEELDLVIKFGDNFDDSKEDVLILPYQEFTFNVAQYLYEMAILAMPQKRVHPDAENGKIGKEILEKLEELSPKETQDTQENNNETDPRWDKLKSFLN
jgi:uncharacterized metal-binding protein YceD (DUF177 family)